PSISKQVIYIVSIPLVAKSLHNLIRPPPRRGGGTERTAVFQISAPAGGFEHYAPYPRISREAQAISSSESLRNSGASGLGRRAARSLPSKMARSSGSRWGSRSCRR